MRRTGYWVYKDGELIRAAARFDKIKLFLGMDGFSVHKGIYFESNARSNKPRVLYLADEY